MRLCVFCGSSPGHDPAFLEAARELGRTLAVAGVEVVYGGATVGLMGAVADASLAAGGVVRGVIPDGLFAGEVPHRGLTELHVVADMHARKAMMADLSDGFVALPGGLGTLEELFEIWTWGQLGLHDKPVALLDVGGFYAPLVTFLDHATEQGFVAQQHRSRLLVASVVGEVLPLLTSYGDA